MGIDVFHYEAFDEEAKLLADFGATAFSSASTWATIQESGHSSPPARVISTRTQSILPPAWAGQLDAVLTRSTGYDYLLGYRNAQRPELACGYLPLYCARAVAEQALLLWMALLRKLPRQLQQFKTFHRDGLTGRECEHKNLLVAGVGNIGHEVVKIGRGLGMEVKGVDLVRRHADVDYVAIDAGLPWADIVVCAMNVTPDNRGYFSHARLSQAKPGTLFVNIARGELSPATDLLRLLEEGRLGGVGLDVHNHEDALAVALRAQRAVADPEAEATLRLLKLDNAVLTPHNAFNTAESVERKCHQSVEQLAAFLKTGAFLWPLPSP